LEVDEIRGWHIHVVRPLSDSWAQRIKAAVSAKQSLKIGIAAPENLFSDEDFLRLCDELNAAVIIYKVHGNTFSAQEMFATVGDLIYTKRLKLSLNTASEVLDRAVNGAIYENNNNRKGVLLELVVAVLLSQVDGFEVSDVGISNRTQQMDVLVHNRNVGGALGGSPIVLAEAKNWKNPVDTSEYATFVRKLQSRHGRAKLGYLITTSRFTAGVSAERRRESMDETLIVLVDGKELPTLWRDFKSITEGFERITLRATVGS
jgi:hypothetical protein